VSDFDSAARIYRRCRAAGVTPRGMVDCMIAAVAWRRQATLLAHDLDIGRVAGVIGIEVDPASLRRRPSEPRGEIVDPRGVQRASQPVKGV
jgi:hypothetical protein